MLTPAVSSGGVSEVAALTDTTAGALGVVETFPALASLTVARAHVWHVDVVVALTRLATTTGLWGVPVVTWGTLVTPGTLVKEKRRTEGKENMWLGRM